MKKLLTLFILMLLWAGTTRADVTIGNGTSNSYGLPIYAYFGYTYSQSIYLKSEINASGNITTLQFYFAGTSLSNSNTWAIYMGHTTKTSFSSTTDWIPVASMTKVYDATFTSPTGPGWITFTLTTPFAYNNSDNLVIAVDENKSSYNTSGDYFYSTSTPTYRGLANYSDSNNPNPASPPTSGASRYSYFPNVILGGITPPPCIAPTAQPTGLTLTSTSSSVSGSFTASASASHYLVVRSTIPTHSAVPVDGTVYTAGMAIGTDTVVSYGTGTTFSSTGLQPNLNYYFVVYAANAAGCVGGPAYYTTGPLNGSVWTAPANPAAFTATAVGSSQINLAATANTVGSYIMVAWNSTSTFGTPTGSYVVGNTITGGGSVYYIGLASGVLPHMGLVPGTTYYYKAWSYNGSGATTAYSSGLTANATTYFSAPYIQDFNASTSLPAGWGGNFSVSATHGNNSSNGLYRNLWSSASTGNATSPFVTLLAEPCWLTFDYRIVNYTSYPATATTLSATDSINVDISNDGGNTYATIYTIKQSNHVTSTSFANKLFFLTAYTGQTIKVRFNCAWGAGDYYVDFDNFALERIPTCYRPTALTVSNLTGTSAVLGWTQPGPNPTSWEVQYGLQGFTFGTGTTISVTDTTHLLNGLTPSTGYAYYVRAKCGPSDSSQWAGPKTFTTTQILANVPFSEPFEVWPNNWSLVNGTQTNQWAVGTATAHNGSKSAYISKDGGVTNTYNNAYSSTVHLYRDIQFSGGETYGYSLNFWYKGLGETSLYDYMNVYIVDPSVVPVAGTLPTAGQVGTNYYNKATWTNVALALANTYTGVKRLVFSWKNDGIDGVDPPIAIDDISVTAVPCPVPTGLAASNIKADSAQLGWSSLVSVFQIEYGPAGHGLGTGTYVDSVANPYWLGGLTPGTSYSYFVRALCAGGIYSDWAGPYTFSTLQIPATIPFSETFETWPNNWAIVNGSQINQWYVGNVAVANSGTNSAYISNDGGASYTFDINTASYVHMYRDINFTGGEQYGYFLSFYWKGTGESCCDYLRVYVADPSVLPVEGAFPASGQVGGSYNMQTAYVQTTLSLPNTVSGLKRLIFTWKNDGSIGTQPPISLDDIEIIPIPCPVPTDLTATNINFKQADIGWSNADTVDIDYGPVGHAPGTGTIIYGVGDNPYQLGGLTTITTYHVYVRQDCGDEVSPWTGPLVFTTSDEFNGVKVYPFNTLDGTGYVDNLNQSKKGPWMNISTTANDTSGRAYFKFDLSTLPYNAIISKATLNYYNFYREGTSSASNTIYPVTVDPMTASGTALYTDCGDGATLWSGTWSGTAPLWISSVLNETGLNFISDQMNSGWAALGIVRGSSFLYRFSGYNDTLYRPYLSLDYHVPTSPLLGMNPKSKDFETVNVGFPSLPQAFRIKNVGIGTLIINSVSIVGADSNQFMLTDAEMYPKNLTEAAFYYVNVAFKPLSTGAKSASLKIVADGVTYTYPLTGTGYHNGPRNLVATPIFGPFVDLTWDAPLPLYEIRYDDNTGETGYWVSSPSTASDMFYTKITIPVNGTLTNIGVNTYAGTVPLNFSSIGLYPELDGKPDLTSPVQTYTPVTVSSTAATWFLGTLSTPLSVVAGQNYYIVTQWPADNTDGPYVNTDTHNDHQRCAWSADAGVTWNMIPYNFIMRAYMDVAGKGAVNPLELTTGQPIPATVEIPRLVASAEPKPGLVFAEEGNTIASVVAPVSANKSLVNYTVHRGTTSGVYTYNVPGVVGQSYRDNTTLPVTTYYYMVSAEYTDGSANSNQAVVTTFAACPTQTQLSATGIQQNSAYLTWNANGTSAWEIEWGLGSFASGTGTIIQNVTANPFPLTGLQSNTTYSYFVRANCGSGVFSDWSARYTFTTACAAITSLPWTEGFEGVTTPNFPGCWVKENGDWVTTYNGLSSYDADAHTGTQFLRDAWSATNEYMWTPGFQLTAGTTYQFSFWWAGDDYAGWTGDVFYNTSQSSTGATQLGESFVTESVTTTKTYAQVVQPFTPSETGVYYFAIRVNCPTSTPWYISFDDFSLENIPTQCDPPTALTALNITATAVDLDWTENNSATTWSIEYGPAGFTQGNGTTIPSVTTKPYHLSGLTPSTNYDFYVKSICALSLQSSWSTAGTFTTGCNAITTLPYTQNFDAVTVPALAPCWTEHASAAMMPWLSADETTSFVIPYSAPNFMYVSYSAEPKNEWLVSPGFQLAAGSEYIVKFWVQAPGTADPEKLKLVVSSDPSVPGLIAGDVLWNDNNLYLYDWTQFEASFTPTSAGVYYFAWHAYSEANVDYIAIDDVSIEEAPPCLAPTGVNVTSIAQTTATLSWVAPVPVPGSGYKYEIRTSGQPGEPAGLVTEGTTSNTSVNLTGLEAHTQYHAYVQSNCGDNVYSDWTADYPFTTLTYPLNVTGVITTPSCAWTDNGAITTTVTGGAMPYVYLWNTGASSANLSSIYAGTYAVTVTDATLASVTGSWTVTAPGEISVFGSATPASCPTAADGSLTVNAAGGTAPFTYLWSTGATTSTITGLLPGTYTVSVNDANNCGPAMFMSNVSYANEVCENIIVTGTYSGTDCKDALNTITTGGTAPFIVTSTGSVELFAGVRIYMLPGSHAMNQSYLHAKIVGAGPFCETLKLTEVTGGKEETLPVTERTGFNLYPNPTTGNFTLVQKGDRTFGNVRVEIYSMSGEKVLTERITGEKEHNFIFSGMASGLYFVKVVADDYVETIKLVKTR